MKKEFVPYELAIKLKQLGFDEPCAMYYRPEMDGSMQLWYHQDERFDDAIGSQNSDKAEWVTCTAPLFQQAFRWFREKYELIGHVRESWSFDNILEYVSQINGTFVNHGIFDKPVNRFETYEEAELACLEKLIEIVGQTNADMTEHGVYK
jgi:hypothetical protein